MAEVYYKFEEETFEENITEISATKIRKSLEKKVNFKMNAAIKEKTFI